MALPPALQSKQGRLTQTLTPYKLADMLAWTGVRHQVVVISACYSGVFIPRLANPNMLVITAADGNHQSFGCRDKAKRSEEHTSELQSLRHLVCRLLLE